MNFKNRTFSRNRLFLAAAALGVCTITAGFGTVASYACFSDSKTVVNEFTTGGAEITETETDWNNEEDGKNIYPGYTTTKSPKVQNTAGILDNDIWVKAVIDFNNWDGTAIEDKERNDLIYETVRFDGSVDHSELAKGQKYSAEEISAFPHVDEREYFLAENETDPEKGHYVYYRKEPLKSAATAEEGETSILFDSIAIPYDWSQRQLDIMGDYQIAITFDVIQKATFENVEDAMAAFNNEEANGTVNKDYKRPHNEGTIKRPVYKDEASELDPKAAALIEALPKDTKDAEAMAEWFANVSAFAKENEVEGLSDAAENGDADKAVEILKTLKKVVSDTPATDDKTEEKPSGDAADGAEDSENTDKTDEPAGTPAEGTEGNTESTEATE